MLRRTLQGEVDVVQFGVLVRNQDMLCADDILTSLSHSQRFGQHLEGRRKHLKPCPWGVPENRTHESNRNLPALFLHVNPTFKNVLKGTNSYLKILAKKYFLLNAFSSKRWWTQRNKADLEIWKHLHFIDLRSWISSVQFSQSVVSDSLWPYESQSTRPPCPSPTPGVYSNSCPSSCWYHPAISSSEQLDLSAAIRFIIRVWYLNYVSKLRK